MDFGYDRYEADPAGLQRTVGEIEGVSEAAGSWFDTFMNNLEGVSNWYGVSDQYAGQMRPNWEKLLANLTDTGGSLRDSILGVNNGHLQELKSINGAQGYALENIDAANTALDTIGADDGSGDGKH